MKKINSFRGYIARIEKQQYLLDWTKGLLRNLYIHHLLEICELRREVRNLKRKRQMIEMVLSVQPSFKDLIKDI